MILFDADKKQKENTGLQKTMTKKYSSAAQKKIGTVMHEFEEGTLQSSSGDKVTKRKQAIAIGVSIAREAHLKVPAKKTASKKKK